MTSTDPADLPGHRGLELVGPGVCDGQETLTPQGGSPLSPPYGGSDIAVSDGTVTGARDDVGILCAGSMCRLTGVAVVVASMPNTATYALTETGGTSSGSAIPTWAGSP